MRAFNPLGTMTRLTHDDHYCDRCGRKFKEHASSGNPFAATNACPSGPFPSWPSSIKDEKKAGAVYDKRVAEFWAKSPGTFRPK